MAQDNPKSTASIAGHPIHPMLVPLPIGFLVGALLTDITYTQSGWWMWAYASSWLIGAGIITALLAALAGFTDFFGERQIRAIKASWLHMIGNLGAVVLEVVNLYLRYTGGAAETVSPVGVVLSAVVVVLLLFNGWMGWELVYRHRVGIAEH